MRAATSHLGTGVGLPEPFERKIQTDNAQFQYL